MRHQNDSKTLTKPQDTFKNKNTKLISWTIIEFLHFETQYTLHYTINAILWLVLIDYTGCYGICNWFGPIIYAIFNHLSIYSHIGLVIKWHFWHSVKSYEHEVNYHSFLHHNTLKNWITQLTRKRKKYWLVILRGSKLIWFIILVKWNTNISATI